MCGGNRRRRAMQYQQVNRLESSLMSGTSPLLGHHTKSNGLNALVGAVSNLAINSRPQPPMRSITPAPEYSSQVPAYSDDIKRPFDVSKEAVQPPAYETVTRGHVAPEVATRELSRTSYNPTKTSHGLAELPSEHQSSSPTVTRLVAALTAAVTAYQNGSGRYMHVKRAQRALRNELYEEEVLRRQVMYGRLRCGEKCEIWREVKAMNLGY